MADEVALEISEENDTNISMKEAKKFLSSNHICLLKRDTCKGGTLCGRGGLKEHLT